MRTLSTLALIAMCCLAASGQSRIYVSNQSTGANNGQNWANAYPDLSVALQSAQAGDSVWVAAGEYRPTSTTDRNISFNLKSGVRLYGGFKGNEQQLTERNWAANQTVLSGDIGAPGDSTDNSFTILFGRCCMNHKTGKSLGRAEFG